jgi:hypothetical protein
MTQLNVKPWCALCAALLLPSWLLAEGETYEVGLGVDVQSVAQIAVSGDELYWSIVAPSTPGAQPEVVQETVVQYLQYSSVLDSRSSPRRITVSRSNSSGVLAEGLLVYITPKQFMGNEVSGDVGKVGAPTLLEEGVIVGTGVLVDDIQTGWTGFGTGEGLRINYTMGMNIYTIDKLEAGLHNNVELVFTLSESP